MKRLLLLLTLVLFVTTACEKDTPDQDVAYEEGASFSLDYAATATCACGGPDIIFSQLIEDSRCPLNVACVWEGQIIVGLTIDGELVELGLSSSDQVDDTTTIGNWTITLQKVNPYPLNDFDEFEDKDYEVELLVESL